MSDGSVEKEDEEEIEGENEEKEVKNESISDVHYYYENYK